MDTDNYLVYTGFWTNWSHGKTLGATLTLSRSDANLLIAFVAFFLTIVTTHLWAIICFAFHCFFSTRSPRDTVHHQRQAVLRNNSGPIGTAWALLQLGWAWRWSKKTKSRVAPLLACSLLLAICFAAAAGFSSKISQGSEVLLSPGPCSVVNETASFLDLDILSTTLYPWAIKQKAMAGNHVQQCYSSSDGAGPECRNSLFVQPKLPTSSNPNAGCPFDEELCATKDSNLILDTGLLDSHIHLGLNTPPESRYQMRKVLHCAPLVTEGYKSPNYTYQYPDPRYTLSKYDNTSMKNYFNMQYKLLAQVAQPFNGSYTDPRSVSSFVPIPGLQRRDADTHLFFLSPNMIMFTSPSKDPWYNSSQQTEVTIDLTAYMASKQTLPLRTTKVWIADEAASPLACTTQLQFCFPNLPAGDNCMPLSGVTEIPLRAMEIGVDEASFARLSWIWSAMMSVNPTISSLVQELGVDVLTSRYGLMGGFQYSGIPEDQWKRDVRFWNDVSLAIMQQALFATAAGLVHELPPDMARAPSTDDERTLCASQKIISPRHVSFSVFGLAFIGVLGLLIIIVSACLESAAHFIQRRFKQDPYARLEWYSTGTLQLQRMAHEALGVGTWSRLDKFVPVSEGNAILAGLNISDEKRPCLYAPNLEANHQDGEDPSTLLSVSNSDTPASPSLSYVATLSGPPVQQTISGTSDKTLMAVEVTEVQTRAGDDGNTICRVDTVVQPIVNK
ncbi:hypothetical protein B0H63DRAFT_543504 [Podospora didyma]|uniref:Uncharacterized protein n=1 Tax=Podospora didyma TaxID=330526 RepID=A0AAE0NPD1_9PEZI|nr:hypothetical protein B0H63DRAFT_543504 [Podospora didyma]